MRKMLDKTEDGELWMEVVANKVLYHIEQNGGAHHVTALPSEARKIWRKVTGYGDGKSGGGVK